MCEIILRQGQLGSIAQRVLPQQVELLRSLRLARPSPPLNAAPAIAIADVTKSRLSKASS